MQETTAANGLPKRERSNSDIKKILYKIIGNWIWFILSFSIFSLFAFLYLRYTQPTYKITAKLLVNDSKSGGSAEDAILSDLGFLSSQSNVDNEVQILKSRTLMYKVIDDLQLNITYTGEGNIKKIVAYKNVPFTIIVTELASTVKNGRSLEFIVSEKNKKLIFKTGDKTYTGSYGDIIKTPECTFFVQPTGLQWKAGVTYGFNIVSPDDAYAQLSSLLTVAVTNSDVTTIDLSVTSPVAQKGEDILNHLINVYVKSNIDENNRIADSTISFIDSRLAIVQNELGNVESSIASFKRENSLADIGEQSKLLVNTDVSLKQQLSGQEVQIQVIASLEQYLADETNNNRIMPTTAPIQDPAFVATLEKYNDLQLQREQQLTNSTGVRAAGRGTSCAPGRRAARAPPRAANPPRRRPALPPRPRGARRRASIRRFP